MEVTYALQPDDLWVFNQFIIGRIFAFKLRIGVRWFVVPLCIMALAFTARFEWLPCLLFGAAAAIAWVPFCLWSIRRHAISQARKQPSFLEKQTLIISGDGVRQLTTHADSLVHWNGIVEIAENDRQILFLVDRQHALIVPKSAFAGLEGATEFSEAARRYKAGLNVEVPAPANVWPPPPRSVSGH